MRDIAETYSGSPRGVVVPLSFVLTCDGLSLSEDNILDGPICPGRLNSAVCVNGARTSPVEAHTSPSVVIRRAVHNCLLEESCIAFIKL